MEAGFELRLRAWRAVSALPASDHQTGVLRSEVLELLRGEHDPFDQVRSPHLGASALLTTSDNMAVLLGPPRGGDAAWRLPSDHVDPEQDEFAGMAALRAGRAALRSERPGLGALLLLRRLPPCGVSGTPAGHLSLCFHVSTPDADPPVMADFAWIEYDDALAQVDSNLRAALHALRVSGTSRERNQISLRRTFGLRHDLPWVRDVLGREARGDPDITYSGGMARIPVVRGEACALDQVAASGERLGEAESLLPEDVRAGAWQDGHAFVIASTQVPDPALAARMSELLDVEVRLVEMEHTSIELADAASVLAADRDIAWSSCGVDMGRNKVHLTSARPEHALRVLEERYPHLAPLVEVEWVPLDPRELPAS